MKKGLLSKSAKDFFREYRDIENQKTVRTIETAFRKWIIPHFKRQLSSPSKQEKRSKV